MDELISSALASCLVYKLPSVKLAVSLHLSMSLM